VPKPNHKQPADSSRVLLDSLNQYSSKEVVKLYEPWNVMIYFLSGSIDMIAVIGYISAIRFLKSEIRVLGNKEKAEEERMRAEKER
jgi:hypothetical protein